MNQGLVVLERLKNKVSQLVADNVRQQDAINRLRGELSKRDGEIERLKTNVKELEDKIKVLELTQGIVGVAGGAKAARDRVNRLLREVDKCIALMNK